MILMDYILIIHFLFIFKTDIQMKFIKKTIKVVRLKIIYNIMAVFVTKYFLEMKYFATQVQCIYDCVNHIWLHNAYDVHRVMFHHMKSLLSNAHIQSLI